MTGIDPPARLRMIVSGRVQGVYFRGSAAEQARALGVTGYAQNLEDGRVEIVAEGKRQSLESLVAWARRGPRAARVDKVELEWGDSFNEFDGFCVL